MGLLKHISLVKIKGLVKFKGLVKAIGLIKAILQPPAIDKIVQWLGKTYQNATTNLWYQEDQIGDREGTVYLGSFLDMNGIDNLISFSDLSGITIVDSAGTSTINIVGDDITATAGTIEFIELSTGDFLYFDEKDGDTVFGTKGIVGILQGTLTAIRQEDASIYSYINEFGYNEGGCTNINLIDSEFTTSVRCLVTGDLISGYQCVFSGATILPVILGWNGKLIGNGLYRVSFDAKSPNISNIPQIFDGASGVSMVQSLTTDWQFFTLDLVINDALSNRAYIYWGTGIDGSIVDVRNISFELIYGNTVLVPALQSNPNEDVLGNSLVNKGQVRLDVQLINSNIVEFNGTDNFLSFNDLTGITIVSYEGTAIPTKSGNNINYTAGTASYLELSNGSYYTFAEGASIHYDKSANELNATPNGTLTSYYNTDNEVRPYNLLDGFDLWQNDGDSTFLYVPFDSNGDSIKTDGDTIAGYTWISKNPGTIYGHNNAETQYLQPAAPALVEVANNFAVNPWFNGSNIPIPCDWETIANDYEDAHQWFADVFSKYPIKFDWIVYSEALSGDDLNKIYEFVNSRFFAIDADSDTAIDADGDSAYDTN